MSGIDIEVSEVGPRDGLHSIKSIMPTEAKKMWISAEAAAGVPEIEVGSFVLEDVFATHVNDRLAESFCVPSFPVCSGVSVREIGNQELAASDLDTKVIVDATCAGLLIQPHEFEPRSTHGGL